MDQTTQLPVNGCSHIWQYGQLLWCQSKKLIQELQYLTTVWKIDYLSAAWILFSSTNLRTLHFKIEFSLNPCVRFVLPLASLLYMATGGSGMDFSCPCSWYPAHDPGSCFFFWHPATCYGTFSWKKSTLLFWWPKRTHLAFFLFTVETTEALLAQACRSAGTGPSRSHTGSWADSAKVISPCEQILTTEF